MCVSRWWCVCATHQPTQHRSSKPTAESPAVTSVYFDLVLSTVVQLYLSTVFSLRSSSELVFGFPLFIFGMFLIMECQRHCARDDNPCVFKIHRFVANQSPDQIVVVPADSLFIFFLFTLSSRVLIKLMLFQFSKFNLRI